MSYHSTSRRVMVRQQALGLDLSQVLQAGGDLLNDPALPRVVELVLELRALEKGGGAAAPKASAPAAAKAVLPAGQRLMPIAQKLASLRGLGADPSPGIGLQRVVKPLEFYVETRRKPWLLPTLVVGALAVPFLIGYKVGRRKR